MDSVAELLIRYESVDALLCWLVVFAVIDLINGKINVNTAIEKPKIINERKPPESALADEPSTFSFSSECVCVDFTSINISCIMFTERYAKNDYKNPLERNGTTKREIIYDFVWHDALSNNL